MTLFPKALALAALCALPAAASAATLKSTFDAGTEGWTLSGGTLSHQATGGNPDGYLRMTDTASTTMTLSAPNSFLGVPLKDGGTIGFDFRFFTAPGTPVTGGGTVTLFSGSASASRDLIPGNPINNWVNYSATLTAANWGVSQSVWDGILANVTGITINVEARNGLSEQTGLDNFSVETAVIPLPAGLPLMAGALGLAWGLSRRRRG